MDHKNVSIYGTFVRNSMTIDDVELARMDFGVGKKCKIY